MKLKQLVILLICLIVLKTSATFAQDTISDDFNDSIKSSTIWEYANRTWAAGNPESPSHGGVIPALINIRNGVLTLRGDGNLYAGSIMGFGRKTKVGSCVISKSKHASGRYEFRAKIIPQAGALSAFWTFEFEAYPSADSGNINHEIDIEVRKNGTDFNQALCNTWIYENVNTLRTNNNFLNQADGNYHLYRFDWHTGGNGIIPRVEFYYDDELKETITTTVPYHMSQLWIGNWFPSWAGTPDFAVDTMFVDWVKVTPFHELNDSVIKENPNLAVPDLPVSGSTIFQIYPNPCKSNSPWYASFDESISGSGTLELFGASGKEISSQTLAFANGRTTTEMIPITSPGIYMLRFSMNGRTYLNKLSVF